MKLKLLTIALVLIWVLSKSVIVVNSLSFVGLMILVIILFFFKK